MQELENETVALAAIGHPKGTLAVVVVYMLLFVLGWAGLYLGTFLPRGAPDAEVPRGFAAPATEAPSTPGTVQ